MGTNEKTSIFDYNIAFLGLSEKDIAAKTGISTERVKQIASGSEPFISELLTLSITFDRSLISLVAGEWFMHRFGEYYRAQNEFLEKVIESGDIRSIAFIFSSGLIVKSDDELKFVRYGRVFENRRVEGRLAKKAIAILLEHGLAETASEISTTKVFYPLSDPRKVTFTEEVLKKYLFLEGRGSWYPYFVPLFNRLSGEKEKQALLTMAEENLKAYAGRTCILWESDDKPCVYYVNGTNEIKTVSAPWSRCDFSLLDTESELAGQLEKLQEEIFAAAVEDLSGFSCL